jgi:tetratricopeptide (TPR) repeat protein
MKELPDDLYNRIVSCLEKGDEAFENSLNTSAQEYYHLALEAIPEPKTDWEIALHVHTASGDNAFNMEDYESAIYHYSQALQCPDGLSNGYVWLGLGQSYFEIDATEKAKDALMSAYMLEGKEIFDEVDDRYIQVIEDFINDQSAEESDTDILKILKL